jgi:ornithine carbamoyltransferase
MLAMIFEKPSTRTRVSFDVGMRQLGGETMVLNGADMQLGRGETVADTARVLSRYVDAIMIRTTAHEKLLETGRARHRPGHQRADRRQPPLPADGRRDDHRGASRARRRQEGGVVGRRQQHGAQPDRGAGQFGFSLALACPEALDVEPRYLDWARAGRRVRVTRDPAEAVAGADAVITDTWLSMGDQGEARERRHNLLRPYQVDDALMAQAKPDALFLHCLPAHRGEEATAAVMDGPQSVIFDEAENRLHAQKAEVRRQADHPDQGRRAGGSAGRRFHHAGRCARLCAV